MIQLRILSGKMAGDIQVVRRFPFHIGRAAGNDLCLDDAGVWDRHLTLDFQKNSGINFHAIGDAFVAVNEQPQTTAWLHNGDILSFGSAKIQFWLAVACQRSLRLREFFVWLLLIAVTAFQFFLIYRLLK